MRTRSRHLTSVLLAGLMFTVAACDDGSTGTVDPDATADTSNTPMATQFEVTECKESCNQLKFFDCNDSVEHAVCFSNCEQADSGEIELFNACVRTDICDPTCGQQIEPPEPPPPPADDCTTLCTSFATECNGGDSSFCAEACGADANLTTYCLSRRAACELPEECTDGGGTVGPEDPADACKAACQSQGFFGCIQPTDVATCQGLCDTVEATTRDGFAACVQASTGCSGCYEQLGGTTSVNVSGCQQACDDLAFFDCVDAGTQATCRNTCASSTDAMAVDNFIACAMGICQDDSCLDVLSPVTPTTCPEVPCPSGQTCNNGVCETTNPGTCPEVPCPSGQTCNNGVCEATNPGTCPDSPCGADQICQSGQCVARPATCSVTLNGNDGCDHDEICFYDENDNTYCYQARACDAGDMCTPDNLEAGAVCSTGLINGKSAVCIPDSCTTDADCITDYHCADVDGLNFGACTSGTEFDYCHDTSDCVGGLTCNAFNYCE